MKRSWVVVVAGLLAWGGLGAAPALGQEAEARQSMEEIRLELPVEPGGLTADSVAARAVAVAPQVESADLARQQAERNASLGRIAYAPRLDLSASYTRLSPVDTPAFDFGGVTFDNPFEPILNNYDLRATLTVDISSYFLTIAPSYQALEGLIDVRGYEADTRRLEQALQAQQAFYGHLRARASLLVAEDAVALLTAHIEDLEALFRAGVVTRAEVMQARAQLAEAEQQRVGLTSAIETTGILLRRILNLAPNEPLPIGEDVNEMVAEPLPDESTLTEQAMDARPEVNALRALVRVQQSTFESQRGERWPRLQLIAGADYANPNPRIIPQEEAFSGSWDLTLALSWSPNDAVQSQILSEQTAVRIEQAQHDLEAIEDGIAVEVANALSDHRTALAAHEAALQGVYAAREAYRVQRELLAAGEATANEALDAEISIRRSTFALIDASIAARLARVRLEHALGRRDWGRGGE